MGQGAGLVQDQDYSAPGASCGKGIGGEGEEAAGAAGRAQHSGRVDTPLLPIQPDAGGVSSSAWLSPPSSPTPIALVGVGLEGK